MRVHIIAIGGSIMHQLAINLKLQGYQISGSDDEIFDPALSNLKKHELVPDKMGWHEENINLELDFVILGMHAKADNPELLKAQKLHIKIYSFPEFVYENSINKIRIAIAGSHGKTSTTAFLMQLFKMANIEFDYLVGAKISGFEYSVSLSSHAKYLLCEADEYPESNLTRQPKFFIYRPHIAVITGIAWDHINIFPTFENYCWQFQQFISKMEENGVVFYNSADNNLVQLINESQNPQKCKFIPYQSFIGHNNRGVTSIDYNGCLNALNIFGDHNLSNLKVATMVSEFIGINQSTIQNTLSNLKLPARRLERLNHPTKIVFNDFAHAPSKVKASIKAVYEQFKPQRILAVLEWHTFSSLNLNFMSEYKGCFALVEKCIIYYSEHALKLKNLPSINLKEVQQLFGNEEVEIINNLEHLKNRIDEVSLSFEVILLMSSGNFDGTNLLKYIA
ncbi:MAG: Mur ligase family protein [Sediminibacterium sp.]|nr:Mur ligase family protein [Sediminibacterium sp.]